MRRPTDVAGKSASQEKLSTDRGALREIAREILDKHSQCSESTQAEYRRVIQRMAGQHWHDYAVKHGLKSVLTVRAAWRVSAARQIIALLGESERGANAEERARARRQAIGFAEQLLESREYCRPTSKSHQKKVNAGVFMACLWIGVKDCVMRYPKNIAFTMKLCRLRAVVPRN